ncbi:carboxymethylenebutenolidase [Pseudovirgaria hyperparasitica]|uniref:Carboxymethylenebutenolidase n=1 Tax=Pseudovirgaria hyperparasitica TaxID=470096 RepID=A0A6A6VTA9_9PEZI|nr:carboxymethylenebutenolidase [Pseudovirgaria hyperparasitica]KAF2753453.1 carboxymethylenebutenolidase [Pseudovirgaria hyperparasitica]
MSQTPSHACCTVPPVVKDGYKEKGTWTTVNGLKTYTTGPSSAKKGILVVYDIFGYFPQTLQGADILATGDSHQNYQVFMPDFFEGKPADISWYPPDNEEKGKKLGDFFNTTAAPPTTVGRIPKILDELKNSTGIQDWGILGYCWGGKIVNLSTQQGTPFKAGAAVHPAMVDAGDASGITVPVALLPSKDESKEDVEKWEKALKVKTRVEWFNDQVHGFMAARGDLDNERVRSEYERGYKILLDWFHDHV